MQEVLFSFVALVLFFLLSLFDVFNFRLVAFSYKYLIPLSLCRPPNLGFIKKKMKLVGQVVKEQF